VLTFLANFFIMLEVDSIWFSVRARSPEITVVTVPFEPITDIIPDALTVTF
jgi:hypothetical protein